MKVKLTGKTSYTFYYNGEVISLKENDEIDITEEEFTKIKMKDCFIIISGTQGNQDIKTENKKNKNTNKAADNKIRHNSVSMINKAVKKKVKNYNKQKKKAGSKKC